MDDRDARKRELESQIYQLDMETRTSALTPGEAKKNRDQRNAIEAELRALDHGGADDEAGAAAARAV